MHIAIFTSSSVQKGKFVFEAIKTADRIIAADCGALSALSIGIIPEVVIGDFDSLDQPTIDTLKTKQIQCIKTSRNKDETDTQLAISYAIEQGATKISLVGGIAGNRFEHTLANIFLTYNPDLPIHLVNGPSKSWIVAGSQTITIKGRRNDLLSLLSLSEEVTGITTRELYYPLLDESLYFGIPRGMSNVFMENTVSITIKSGVLLFVHTVSMQ